MRTSVPIVFSLFSFFIVFRSWFSLFGMFSGIFIRAFFLSSACLYFFLLFTDRTLTWFHFNLYNISLIFPVISHSFFHFNSVPFTSFLLIILYFHPLWRLLRILISVFSPRNPSSCTYSSAHVFWLIDFCCYCSSSRSASDSTTSYWLKELRPAFTCFPRCVQRYHHSAYNTAVTWLELHSWPLTVLFFLVEFIPVYSSAHLAVTTSLSYLIPSSLLSFFFYFHPSLPRPQER